jgi:hypothetical protein
MEGKMREKSLRQQAQDIGVSPAYLSRVLNGKQKVSSRVLRILVDKHKVLPDNPIMLTKNHDSEAKTQNAPNGIRIHVTGLKGRCPGPLDDGGVPLSIPEKTYIRQCAAHDYPSLPRAHT